MASRTGRRMRVILSFGVGRDCAAAAPKRHAPERSAVAGAASAASSSGTHRDQELAAEAAPTKNHPVRSEEHTAELQSLMRISYAGFRLKNKQTTNTDQFSLR